MGLVRGSNDRACIGFDKYNPSASQTKHVFIKPQETEKSIPKAQNSRNLKPYNTIPRNFKAKNPIHKKTQNKVNFQPYLCTYCHKEGHLKNIAINLGAHNMPIDNLTIAVWLALKSIWHTC